MGGQGSLVRCSIGDEPRLPVTHAIDSSVDLLDFIEVQAAKCKERFRRGLFQVDIGKGRRLGIEFPPIPGVSIASTRESANIAIEIRADMKQFMTDRGNAIGKIQGQESRQVKGEDIEGLGTVRFENAGHFIVPTSPNGLCCPIFES